MDLADLKTLARITLWHDAQNSVGKLSAMAWQEKAEDSEEGKLLGYLEVEAISVLIFGRKPLRTRG